MTPKEYSDLLILSLKNRGCGGEMIRKMGILHCDLANTFFASRVTYIPFKNVNNRSIRIKSTAFFDHVKKVIETTPRFLSKEQEIKMILRNTDELTKNKITTLLKKEK